MNGTLRKLGMAAAILAMNAAVLLWAAAPGDEARISESRNSFAAKTDAEEFTLEAGGRTSTVRLILRAKLNDGRLTAQLFDPRGQDRGSFTLETDRKNGPANGRFTPEVGFTPGAWKLRVERKNATGRYEFQWTAR